MTNITQLRRPEVVSVAPDTVLSPASGSASYRLRVIGRGFETREDLLAEEVRLTTSDASLTLSEISVYNSERIDCTLTIVAGVSGKFAITVAQEYDPSAITFHENPSGDGDAVELCRGGTRENVFKVIAAALSSTEH